MEVRLISLKDLHGFYRLFCEVSAEGKYSARAAAPPIEAISRALVQVEKNHWPVYVVEREGQIVGSAEAYPESFCRAGGSDCIGILGIQVRRDLRRCGYWNALLAAVVSQCRDAGFMGIDLTVLKSNSAARSLYDKFGFVWLEDLSPCTLASRVVHQPERLRLVF